MVGGLSDLPMVMCCGDDINQVFMILLINAAHSIEEVVNSGGAKRGLITVRSQRQGGNAVISITDTGMGIKPAVPKKMFESFFTTKADGLGIGLSISRTIVEAHGGKLWAEENADGGALFRFTLPLKGL